jgi:hypothetical protein
MDEKLQFQQASGERLEPTLELRERDSKRLWLFVLAGLCAVYLISIFYTPAPARADGSYFTFCGFKNFTGMPCPGCGLTHSFCAIGKGELGSAFAYNLLGPPLFLLSLLVCMKAVCVLGEWRGPVRLFDRVTARLNPIRVTVVTFLVFGLARILYLLLYDPATVEQAPLARWLLRIAG